MSMTASTARTYLALPLRRREQGHRRAVLIGIGLLIFLSTMPVFGHHLASRAEVLLAGRDHFGSVCLIALHALLAPVHGAFHVLLAVGLAYASYRRLSAIVSLRRTLDSLSTLQSSVVWDRVALACRGTGVRPAQVRIVAGLPTPAFTAGWFRPRVFVAAELVTSWTPDELAAVMGHEAAHVLRRDPLRSSLLRFLTDTLFYIPAMRRLADDMSDEREIAADDFAVRDGTISPLALASAIVRLSEWPNGRDASGLPAAAVGFQRPNLLERRVRRLIGDDVAVGTHITRRSLTSAASCLVLVWLSGLVMAHPLAAADASAMGASDSAEHSHAPGHCRHRHGLPFSHIFCLGASHPAEAAHCPHAGQ